MLRNKVLCLMYCCVAIFSVFTFIRIDNMFKLEVEDKFTVSYLPNVTGVSVYQLSEYSNVMKCNFTTVNNIICNMITNDFFYIIEDNSNGEFLDIILTNDIEEYRILYNRRTRDYMCLSNPFLKNYVPMTYITS